MARVEITATARQEMLKLPMVIRNRIGDVVMRLEKWPHVSGAKPLRGDLHGSYRIRTGDYRIVFTASADEQQVTIWKIGNRQSIYE
jgi:mRNA interferase RelE/StbE